MKRNDFLQFLTQFAVRSSPAIIQRHVYLWIGEVDDLMKRSPTGLFKMLDLHSFCHNLEKTPFSDKGAGRVLLEAIEDWLSREFSRDQRQRALLVLGIDLFYRYRLPLSTFVQLANENRLVVLAISAADANYQPTKPLPEFVRFTPEAITKYVKTILPAEATIDEG